MCFKKITGCSQTTFTPQGPKSNVHHYGDSDYRVRYHTNKKKKKITHSSFIILILDGIYTSCKERVTG